MQSFAEITALAALAVVTVQQILKLNVIPLYIANKYPVFTNIALSVVASIIASIQSAVVNLVTIWDYITYAGVISVLSAITYNMTLRNSEGVQKISNKSE